MDWITVVALFTVLPMATALRPVDEHPCYRSCDFTIPMTCVYNWTVEWYYTLSNPQCGDCPATASHCSNADCFPADGVRRAVSLVNHAFPAPSIQICSGDEVVINVTNSMLNNEGVTIHWHGIFQNGSQFMDGLPMVTQCPITSPGNFEYRFTPYEPGTHWFHSHTGLQRADGMMGPFVIREGKRTDPHSDLYDEDLAEHVIFMTDWHHDTMVTVYARDQWGNGSKVDSILINGKGIAVGTNPPHPPLEVFEVNPNVRYRFRIINGASFFCNMQFSVQDHRLLAIASDGGSFVPEPVDYFRISGGERIDFILATNQSVDNYQIQVIGLDCTNTQGGATKQIAYLHYNGASDPPTVDTLPNIASYGDASSWWKVLPDKSFAQLYSTDPDYRQTTGAQEEHQEYIEVNFGNHTNPFTNKFQRYPQLNQISYYFPTSPVMTQPHDLPGLIFCNEGDFTPGQCDGHELCSCVHTIDVQPNEKVEVILVNPNDTGFSILHPMHLHGQQFKVVAMDRIEDVTVEMVRELLNNGSIVRNENGPRKDVVIVPDGGYTIFQFQGWNPGWWIFHCHIEFHLEEGMALLFNVHGSVPSVPDAFPTCGVWPPRSKELGATQIPTSGTPSTGSPPSRLPQYDNTLNHLGWVVPLTFVVALAIGVVIGKFVLGRKDAGANTNTSVSVQQGETPM